MGARPTARTGWVSEEVGRKRGPWAVVRPSKRTDPESSAPWPQGLRGG